MSFIKLKIYIIIYMNQVFSSESAFASGGQNTGTSASVSVLPTNIQG